MTDSSQNSHREKANDHAEAETAEQADQKDGSRKGSVLSNFLIFAFGSVGLVFIGIAINYHTKGGYDPTKLALLWGIIGYGLFGVGLYFAYFEYVVKPARAAERASKHVEKPREPFQITIPVLISSDGRAPKTAMVLQRDAVCWPVHAMMSIRLTNQQTVRSMIESYTVEWKSKNGEWVKLIPINAQLGTIVRISGDLRQATMFAPELFDSVLVGRSIAPNETVDGWALFEYPKGFEFPTKETRVYVRDFGGAESAPTVHAGESADGGLIGFAKLRVLGKTDLSKCTFAYYSDSLMPTSQRSGQGQPKK